MLFVPHDDFVLLASCVIIEESCRASVSSSVNGVGATYSALPTHRVSVNSERFIGQVSPGTGQALEDT